MSENQDCWLVGSDLVSASGSLGVEVSDFWLPGSVRGGLDLGCCGFTRINLQWKSNCKVQVSLTGIILSNQLNVQVQVPILNAVHSVLSFTQPALLPNKLLSVSTCQSTEHHLCFAFVTCVRI